MGVKTIAMYLPQFHEIPENNMWWGEGFTEWTTVRQGKALYAGHRQPKIPLDHNYYNLMDKGTMENQAAIAKQYGIYGFCFYYYWFSGKRLMETPVDLLLEHPKIDLHFCLCWANENWTRKWDGKEKLILMEQEYGDEEEWERHFNYLLDFFMD